MKVSAPRTRRRSPSDQALQTPMRTPSTSTLQIPTSTRSHGCGSSPEPLTLPFSADPEEALQTPMRTPSTSALQIPTSTQSHACGSSMEHLTLPFSADPEEALQTLMRTPPTSALQIPTSTTSQGCGFTSADIETFWGILEEKAAAEADIKTSPGAKSTVNDELEVKSLISVPITEKLVEPEIAVRLRQALLEVRSSEKVEPELKELLGTLVEAAVGDVGADRCDDYSHLIFLAKARIWMVCFLILMLVVMNLMLISSVFDGDGGEDYSSHALLHPT